MKLEKISFEKKKNKLVFMLKDSDLTLANALRRLIIDEVPTLAVEQVELRDNSSALYDEMIAHRIGLSPIKTDLKSYTLPAKCSCNGAGCAQCQLKITLKAGKKGVITMAEAKSEDPKCTFVYDMPIVKLSAKQRIDIEATAVLGQGKVHAKWSPGLAFFRNELKVDFDDKKLKEETKQLLLTACPKGIIEAKGNKISFDAAKLNEYDNVEGCIELLEKDGIKVSPTENIIFTVESWGQLSCKEILETSADLLIDKSDELIKLLEK